MKNNIKQVYTHKSGNIVPLDSERIQTHENNLQKLSSRGVRNDILKDIAYDYDITRIVSEMNDEELSEFIEVYERRNKLIMEYKKGVNNG